MKKLSLTISFIILISSLIYSQWTNQNPVPDGNDLFSTFFLDDNIGWIVGAGGFIKKTTNAGVEWIQQSSGTTSTLRSVQFIDQNRGWICGESGLILKTTDGGINWDSIASGNTQLLTDIHFCTPDTGYIVGYDGTILKSTNGGSSWASLNSGTTDMLFSIDFVSASTGWVVGGISASNPPTIIKTTDGGINWTQQIAGTNSIYYSVDFVDEHTGFAVGSPGIIKTTDGGNTWVHNSAFPYLAEELKLNLENRHSPPYPSPGYYSIFFKDVNNGCIVGSPNSIDSFIYETTDAGITWEQLYRANWQPPFLSVFVTPNGKGWTAGLHGLRATKEVNDTDWSLVLSGHGDKIYSLYFINENIGWAGAFRYFGQSPGQKVILKKTNGGQIWKSQIVSNNAYSGIASIYFLNALFGWAVSSGGTYETLIGGGIYRTTDGGDNWIQMNSIDCTSVFFINQDTGWVTSNYGSYIGINKSTDGGITWSQTSSINSSSVYFLDNNTGWATSVEGILKSTDGGETWINKSSSSGSYIRFYDSNVGMCVGGGILVSTDGGETWTSKSGPSLQTINFTNSTTIWGYTSDGTLYKTTNFGDTWQTLNTGLGFGRKAFFINEYTGWVGGGATWVDGTKIIWKYSVEPPPPLTPPVWSNQITVKDAGSTESSIVLTLGQHIDATDSIDASLGEYEIPPSPPTGIFDARFNLPTNPQVSSITDFRDSAATEIIWTLQFQPGSAGYPMTFSWDSTSFPQGTFYLKDRINGSFVNVNMKKQSSYILTEPSITSLEISYKGNYSLVSVKNDWNMISVPLLAEDMTLNKIFPTATSLAYSYNGGYLPEDTLEGGVGYWLKFDGDQQIQIFGSKIGNTVPLVIGWNMFGVYENYILVSQITTTPPGIIATNLFGFNDGYYKADTLKSGQGYWVRVTENGVINLNTGGLQKSNEYKQFAEISNSWGKIIITDNKGRSTTLFATEEELDLTKFELPPLPPAGIFDVRFSSGRVTENLSGEKIIQISSIDYPITIKTEGLNITVRDRINGELLNEELNSGEEIRIANNKITSIGVSGRMSTGLPVSYELYQNYPNPFNPGTKIKFAIPQESNVNLSIYNVLGELVSTIVNQDMKAGYYEVEFSAGQTISLSSGVYIYRLSAGPFVETKKMILLR